MTIMYDIEFGIRISEFGGDYLEAVLSVGDDDLGIPL